MLQKQGMLLYWRNMNPACNAPFFSPAHYHDTKAFLVKETRTLEDFAGW